MPMPPPNETVESVLANVLQLMHAFAYLQHREAQITVARDVFERFVADLTVCLHTVREARRAHES